MRHEFGLQDPGEGIHEVEIVELLVAEGDEVREGEDVLVVESDKAAVELPSPHSGRIAEIRVAEGDVAEVGDVPLVIEDDAGEAEAPKSEEDEEDGETGTRPRGDGARGGPAPDGDDAEAERDKREPSRDADEEEDEKAEAGKAAEEEARKETDEETQPETEEAGGERARKTRERPETETRERPDGETRKARETEGSKKAGRERPEARRPEGGPVRAAPAARRLARDEGLDLSEVEATGSQGQITLGDVRRALGDRPEREPKPEREAEDRAPDTRAADREADREDAGDRDDFGPVERQPLRGLRAATARAMARAWSEIPHVTHEDAADITELERWRRDLVARSGDEALTLTPFLVKAAAAVLPRRPRFNASLAAEHGEIVLRR